MDSRFSLFLAFFFVAIVVSHADLSPEEYWSSVLPNTRMPKAIEDLLVSDLLEGKSTSVNVGKGGVHVNTKKGKSGGTSVNVGNGGVNVHTKKGKSGGTSVNVGKGGVNVHDGHKGKPIYVGVKPGTNPFVYTYAATKDQLHDNPNVALFFLENNLRVGTKLTIQFPKTSLATSSDFLPRDTAETMPFSSDKLHEILDHFSVKPKSIEAEMIRKTIEECEAPGISGEDKYCATSLESMVDFSMSKLGKKVTLISTEVEKETSNLQEFTVVNLAKKSTNDDKAVVCHKLSYPYAVFYCHSSKQTRAYEVNLVGADGAKADVAAICHADTSAWNPKHLAFQLLKVKPGTVPICHFLPRDHVVWVSKY